jgi:hypothetical protein
MFSDSEIVSSFVSEVQRRRFIEIPTQRNETDEEWARMYANGARMLSSRRNASPTTDSEE